MRKKLQAVYEKKYKLLLLIPFILLVLALLQLGIQYSMTGDFVNKGVSLKGGSTITISNDPLVDIDNLESYLKEQFPRGDINVRTISSGGRVVSVAIDSDAQETEEIEILINAMTDKIGSEIEYNIEVMGSSLGKSFFKETLVALLIAFILMGIVVLIYFRTFVPSIAVILAAFSDMVVTLAIFNIVGSFTGMKLSTAGIAAFLMLIGYSVDTDILLSSRLLKRKEGSLMERVYGAMRTGLTMSSTTLMAVLIAMIFVQSEVIKQIMVILFIGLLVDLVMTWIQNVGILRLYLEKKKSK